MWTNDDSPGVVRPQGINTLRPRQNGRHFADDIFKCIFLNENVWIPIKISLKFVPQGPINNIPALVQIMAWRRPSDKPLSEPMMVRLPTHICVTRPQWVKEPFENHESYDATFVLFYQPVCSQWRNLEIYNDQWPYKEPKWHFRPFRSPQMTMTITTLSSIPK